MPTSADEVPTLSAGDDVTNNEVELLIANIVDDFMDGISDVVWTMDNVEVLEATLETVPDDFKIDWAVPLDETALWDGEFPLLVPAPVVRAPENEVLVVLAKLLLPWLKDNTAVWERGSCDEDAVCWDKASMVDTLFVWLMNDVDGKTVVDLLEITWDEDASPTALFFLRLLTRGRDEKAADEEGSLLIIDDDKLFVRTELDKVLRRMLLVGVLEAPSWLELAVGDACKLDEDGCTSIIVKDEWLLADDNWLLVDTSSPAVIGKLITLVWGTAVDKDDTNDGSSPVVEAKDGVVKLDATTWDTLKTEALTAPTWDTFRDEDVDDGESCPLVMGVTCGEWVSAEVNATFGDSCPLVMDVTCTGLVSVEGNVTFTLVEVSTSDILSVLLEFDSGVSTDTPKDDLVVTR